MRTAAVVISLVLTVLASSCAPSRVGMSYSATYGWPRSYYYYSVCEYYGVPEREIILIRDRGIPDEDIPVVFFIAQRAHVAPIRVIDMRSRGESWMDISLHFGLGPEVYYVPMEEVSGPPYGRAYGYYRNRPRAEWKAIRLSDNDVVNFVNLRFVTEHYSYAAPDVIRMRSKGKSFVDINDEIRTQKHGRDEGRGKGKRRG